MHIILGFLSSVVTILWLLHRLAEMGIDLGGLNPWSWRRRRKFRTAYEGDPIFRLDDPMEAAAVLMVSVAKADGDMSGEERKTLLEIFGGNFHLSDSEASALLTASTHLYGNGESARQSLGKILKPSADKFSTIQSESTLDMLERIARVDGPPSEAQTRVIDTARTELLGRVTEQKHWH